MNILWIPKSGNTAPKQLLVKEFAARAEVAKTGYASTRNVHVHVNAKEKNILQ